MSASAAEEATNADETVLVTVLNYPKKSLKARLVVGCMPYT
jgi:hypothetical protein